MPTPAIMIKIVLPSTLLNFGKKLEKKLPGCLRRIAMEGKSFWKAEAGRKLKSTRNDYVKSIDFEMIDNLSFYLILDNPRAVEAEEGYAAFDMKPGLLKNAKAWPPPNKKRKIPRHLAALLPKHSSISRYQIIPLNARSTKDGSYGAPMIAMTKPKVFRMVTDQSPNDSWIHPGFKGVHLLDSVIDEITNTIVPKHVDKLIKDVLNGNSP